MLMILLVPILGWAQPKDNSPYSRFGIGDIYDDNFIGSQHMGGLGASFIDPYNINIVNPASLSYLATASFDIGLHAEYSTLKDIENQRIGRWNGNLNYMSLSFPLQNALNDILDRKERDINLGMGFTLMPYSTVGYDISTFFFDENFGTYEVNYQGSGGSYQFLWSNGVRYKNWAFGINTGYLFGKISNLTRINFPDTEAAFGSNLDNSTNISGFVWRMGLMYTHFLNKSKNENDQDTDYKKLVFGIYGNSKSGLNYNSNTFETSILGLPDGSQVIDTFMDIRGDKSEGKLPSEFGAGISYVDGSKLMLGVNYETTAWSQFEGNFVNNNLKDTYKLSFGGYYRPNYKSITSYLSRVYYRFGGFYQKVPVEIAQGEDISDYGISFGLGMPFFYQRKISHANLGVTLGWRGLNTSIEERYLRFTFSFTFNDDEWFIKRKYN